MCRRTALFLISAILIAAHMAQAQSPCPTITVSGVVPEPYSPTKLRVDVSGIEAQDGLTFNWSVSAGVITSGQGTNIIAVDFKHVRVPGITATVKVNGLPAGCRDEAEEVFLLFNGPVAIPKGEYGRISLKDEEERLLSFAKEVRRYPGATANITYYADSRARAGEVRRRARRAKRYLIKSGLRPAQITVVDGGIREDQIIALYVVTRGSRPTRRRRR